MPEVLSPEPVDTGDRSGARGPWFWVALVAAAATLGWLPFMWRSLSPDEGGLLMLAAQWEPGSSLYGDYWVDRPPLLVGLFAVADGLGGPVALRAMGVVAVVATIFLAGVIGRLAAPTSTKPTADKTSQDTRRIVWPAATAALFLATPLFGGSVVSAELLGLPFVLAGVAAALVSLDRSDPRTATGWALAAGAAGAAAFLVKQNIVDVFVFVAVVAVAPGLRNPGPLRSARLRLVGGVVCGAVALTAVVLAFAAARGTGVAGIWNGVVVFRGEAFGLIAQSGNAATGDRLMNVLIAFGCSGAPLVVAALTWGSPARRAAARAGLRPAAWALLAWEALVVLVGGGYWLHYLMGFLPGLVVLAAASVPTRPRSSPSLVAAYVYATCSTVAVLGWVLVNPIERPEAPAIAYLEDHSRPGDTGIVAFGAANILETTGLRSPYPHLWSLPARVRDPRTLELADVLAGPEAPTWLVVSGRSVTTWGVDGAAANRVVRARYEVAARAGKFWIYLRNDRP